jgi:hypothetical protein
VVERDLAKVDVAGSTPVSRSNFHGKASRPRSFFHPAIGRGTQVVRERSAKPLYVGSIPTRASTYFPEKPNATRWYELTFLRVSLRSSLVLIQGAVQFANQTHQLFRVAFFAGLFGKVVPITRLVQGHNHSPLSTATKLLRSKTCV